MPPESTATARPGAAPEPTREPTPEPTGQEETASASEAAAPEEAPSEDLTPELPPDLASAPSQPLSTQAGDGEAPEASAARPATEPDAVLPAPYVEPRPGFWRRLRIGRTRRMAREEARDDKMSEIEARLGAIEERLSSIDQGLGLRFDRVEQRFLQFWEMEEQLTQLTEITDRLEEVRRAQKEVSKAAETTRGGMRTLSLTLAAAVVVLGLVVAAMVLGG
jgi:hypothetical protein